MIMLQCCRCLPAEHAPDESFMHSQQLFADLEVLPKEAKAVGQLLKHGCLPVPHHVLASMSTLTNLHWQLGKVGLILQLQSFLWWAA